MVFHPFDWYVALVLLWAVRIYLKNRRVEKRGLYGGII